MDYPQEIADQMKKGLSNEIRKICEIGRVLRESGLSRTEVNYYMSIDEDFIPDVLSCYKGVEKRKPVSPKNNLNPWIDHPKKCQD
jgi:hypothetical protein|tara:strand:+ start:249 stop:503 length:255 start_codon:yes stop_codon:yes gene_type:complete